MRDYKEIENLLDKSIISTYNIIDEPPILIILKGIPIATLGNFSAVIGKPKSKKSFYIQYIISEALNNRSKELKFHLQDKKQNVIYFDTEQSKYHTQKSMERALTLAQEDELNIVTYNLREYDPETRILMIEQVLDHFSKFSSLVVIDGLRDLVTSINNEDQASYIISKLLKWTQEHNIHIIIVLHQNKGDMNARGHLGTEVINKAETTISIMKDSDNENISHVKCEYARDKEFKPFSFEVNEKGLPVILNNFDQVKPERAKKKKNNDSDVITDIIKLIFKSTQKINYSDLKDKLKEHCIMNELPAGTAKINGIIKDYKNRKILTSKAGPNNTTIYQLTN